MGVDVARAVAIIGMVAAHTGASPTFELTDPTSWDALVHGRSSIVFAVVAGVSIAFVTARAREATVDELRVIRLGLVGRGAAVFVIGLVLELVGTQVAVVLTVYGLVYVAVIPFITWSRRRLVVVAAVATVVCPPVLAVSETFGQGPATVLAFFSAYPVTVWMVAVLAGLVVGRSRLDLTRTAALLVLAGAVLAGLGYGVGAAVGPGDPATAASESAGSESAGSESGASESGASIGTDPLPADRFDLSESLCTDEGAGLVICSPADEAIASAGPADDPSVLDVFGLESVFRGAGALVTSYPHSGGSAEIAGSIGVALVVIGLCLLVSRPLRWVLWPLAALGSCALTAYVLHAVVLSAWFIASLRGWVTTGPETPLQGVVTWGLLVAATVWSLTVGRGPLERSVAAVADRTALRSRGRPVPDHAGRAS